MNSNRRDPTPKNENPKISPQKEQEDLESAFHSSTGFANPYGEDDKLSPEDDEFDFGVEEAGHSKDFEQIKKSYRH